MANPHNGEVLLVAGKDTYTLKFSMNALAEIENLLDTDVQGIADMVSDSKFKISPWRAILWGALRERHEGIDLFGAGDVMQAAGIPATVAAVGKALDMAFPKAEAGDRPNPPMASPDGTGRRSKSPMSRPDFRPKGSGRKRRRN